MIGDSVLHGPFLKCFIAMHYQSLFYFAFGLFCYVRVLVLSYGSD